MFQIDWSGCQMFKDAIDQIKDDEYIDGLHRQINGLKNDIEIVDQQNLSIMKTAEKYKRKTEKLEQQNKRYREVINNINEKAILYGVDEQVYEAIQEAIRALECEE